MYLRDGRFLFKDCFIIIIIIIILQLDDMTRQI